MKRRILLVDDDVAVLLTFKAVLEISGFDVDTAASAREGKSRIRSREYHMVISDMRMESEIAGREVIQAARLAPYHPAVALLTAFPEDETGWDGVGPDKILVKATHTRVLLQHIEKLFHSHSAKLSRLAMQAAGTLASVAATGENGTSSTGASSSEKAKVKPSISNGNAARTTATSRKSPSKNETLSSPAKKSKVSIKARAGATKRGSA